MMPKTDPGLRKGGRFYKTVLIILFILLAIAIGTGYYLAISDQKEIAEWASDYIEKESNIKLSFDHYHLNFFKDFPMIAFQLEETTIEGDLVDGESTNVLELGSLSLSFHPWELIKKEYKIRAVKIENGRFHLFKNKDGISNFNFTSKGENAKLPSLKKLDLDKITFNNFEIDITNQQNGKSFQFNLSDIEISPDFSAPTHSVEIDGITYFKGLTFKSKNGPFLKEQKATLDLKIEFDSLLNNFVVDNSSLSIDGNSFDISAEYSIDETSFLKLGIANEEVYLSEVLPLLDQNVQNKLSEVKIDKPIQLEVLLNGPLISNNPIPVQVDFSTKKAQLKYLKLVIEKTDLTGRFANDCYVVDKVRPETSCLDISIDKGLLFGTMPIKAKGRLKDLKNLKELDMTAQVDAAVQALIEYLPEQEKIAFDDGLANLELSYKGDPKTLGKLIENRANTDLAGDLKLKDVNLSYGSNALAIENLTTDIRFDENNIFLDAIEMKVAGVDTRLDIQVMNLLPWLLGNADRLDADILATFDDRIRVVEAIKVLSGLNEKNPKNNETSGEQIIRIVEEINKNLNARLSIKAVEVVYDSLVAKNLSFDLIIQEDSLQKEQTIARVDNLTATIFGNSPVNASLYLHKLDIDPTVELELSTITELVNLNPFLPSETIALNDGEIDLDIQTSFQINHYENVDSLLRNMQLDGSIKLMEAGFEMVEQNQKVEKANGEIKLNEKYVALDSLSFKSQDINPTINGKITNYLPIIFKRKEAMDGDVNVSLPYLNLNPYLNKSGNSNQDSSSFSPSILLAPLKKALALASGNFKVQIAEVELENYPMSDLNLTGRLLDDCLTTEGNSCLMINQFSTILWETTPVYAVAELIDFDQPFLDTEIQIELPVKELQRFLPPEQFQFQKGNATIDILYAGELHKEFNTEKYFLEADVDANLDIKDGGLYYTPRGYQFDNFNGVIHFDEKELNIHNAKVKLNGNEVSAWGKSVDFMPYFILPDREVHIDLELDSPQFDFDGFLTPAELGVASNSNSLNLDTLFVGQVNDFLEKTTVEFNTHIGEVFYRNFDPKLVEGNISLGADSVLFKNVQMAVADGGFFLNGSISNIIAHEPKIDVQMEFDKNNISDIFKSFNNFGQEDMTHENISGSVMAAINFKTEVNSNYEVLPSSIKGDLRMKLYDGQIKNMQALKRMTKWPFRKRQFDNIHIDTMKAATVFDGLDIIIDHFYIHSSSFDLGADGVYSLSGKDESHMLFELPVGNFFKRHIDRETLSQKKGRRGGFNILIEAKEKKKKMKFRWKLFRKKKFKKRKINEDDYYKGL